jgi:hypothetical protein
MKRAKWMTKVATTKNMQAQRSKRHAGRLS